MGKKDKKKQGRGQEKTQQKSEAKAAKRTKKEAANKGEDDVEALIAEFVAKDKKQVRHSMCWKQVRSDNDASNIFEK